MTGRTPRSPRRSEEHTSELQSRGHLVCRPLLEKKKRRFYHNCHVGNASFTGRGRWACLLQYCLNNYVYCSCSECDMTDNSTFFFLMVRRPERCTLFPYTTLFR